METGEQPELRAAAIARLRKKRDLQAHLITFVAVNAVLVGIWYVTNPDGFFWPIFPLGAWAVGVVLHVWDVLSPEVPTEARIEREMRRQAGRRSGAV